MQQRSQSREQPWVTFCMTTYKRPEFLRNQISSILKQTFQDFQVIISDNDSSASAREIVDSFQDPRIQYYVNEENLGMVRSFNRSLERAQSEYVVMITDDDPVYPDMLMTLRNLSNQFPGYGMYMGGCDIMCQTPEVAHASRLKVGTNSCLADLPIGTVRRYSGWEFPFSYFKGEIGGHLLWSTGIVKREIAMAIGGMPDFGAPYNTDFGYIVLSGAQQGAVLVNSSLGCQVVHGSNYGFTESDFEKFYITPNAFFKWIMERLPNKHDYSGLHRYIETFLARWVVEYAVSIKKFMRRKRVSSAQFDQYVKKIFSISYLRRWRWKYYLALRVPLAFEAIISIKRRFFSPKNRISE